jgi:hypothetical protein
LLVTSPPNAVLDSWTGGASDNEGYSSRIDSRETRILRPIPGGSLLKREDAGFKIPRTTQCSPP